MLSTADGLVTAEDIGIMVLEIAKEFKMEELIPRKTRLQENSKFYPRHEIIDHREMIEDRITDRKGFNEGDPPLRELRKLSHRWNILSIIYSIIYNR